MSRGSDPLHQAAIVHISGAPVQRVQLRVPTDYIFEAGQYLNVVHDTLSVPLSIASAPHQLPVLDLHYRSTPGLPEAAAMDAALAGPILNISDAQGEVRSGDPARELLIIAGGSGAAQAFSCALHRQQIGATGTCTILWCANETSDLYGEACLRRAAHLHIHVADNPTPGHPGLRWLHANCRRFSTAQVILAGPPGFVYSATDILLDGDFTEAQLQSDVYSYAPRQR